MAIENDKVVSISYELKDSKNGEILDTNRQSGGQPLEFLIGRGQIIPGLENELKQLDEGSEKEILVKSTDAYGEYKEEGKQTLPKEQFAGIELVEGMTLFGQGEDGQQVQVSVLSFNDSEVTIDYNHPLAGKDLLFDVKIVEVRDATEDELATGVVGGAHACCGGGSCGDHDHGHDHHHHGDGECCHGAHHEEQGGCCGAHH